MAKGKQNFKAAAKKSLAVLSSVALLLSCGTTGLFTANAATTEGVTASAASGEATKMFIYDSKGNDITSNPIIYLDNSSAAGGATSAIITAKIENEQGGVPNNTGIYAALDSQPTSKPHVSMSGIDNTPDSFSVKVDALEYNQRGEEVPYKEGTTNIHFTAADGKLYRTVTVVVYNPATDLKLFWGDKNTQLSLNDDNTTNTTGVFATANHKYQIFSELVSKDSTDVIEYHVYDGIYTGKGKAKATDKAEITQDGLFTPKKNGTVTIVAKMKATETSDRSYSNGEKKITEDNKTVTMSSVQNIPKYIQVIIVKENPAKSIKITNAPSAMEANDTCQLNLDTEPSYTGAGYETGATDIIRWESSNPSIATVDSKGLVKAVGKGEVKITAYGENDNVYAECDIRVLTRADSVVISPKPTSTRVGVSIELQAKMGPDTADDEIVWTSSDPSIATVESKTTGEFTNTQTAIVTGVSTAPGKNQVIITARAKNSGREDQCTVTVGKKIASDNLTLSTTNGQKITPIADDSTLTLYTFQDLTINSRLTSDDGADADDKTIWTIDDNDDDNVTIQSSDSKSIVLHGASEGQITVTACSEANPEVKKSFYINVLRSCDLNKSNIISSRGEVITTTKPLQVGNLISLTADLKIEGNYPYKHSDRVVSWTSSNPDIATVDNYGNVRAIRSQRNNSTCTITATTASGQSKSVRINVFTTTSVTLGNVTPPADSSSLPTVRIEMNSNFVGTKTLSTSVRDDNNIVQSNTDCTWTSSDEEVATVSEKGVINAVGVGTTTVTARSGSKEESCLVTVIATLNSNDSLFEEPPTYTYSPLIKAYEPRPIITVAGKVLTENVDYTLEYQNNTKAGNASVKITGIGLYKDSKTIQFKINPKVMEGTDFTVSTIEDQKCTGKEIKPAFTISCLGVTLIEGTDFDLRFTNNSKPSTDEAPAIIKIVGKGNYSGEINHYFRIYCNHEELKNLRIVKKPLYDVPGIQRGNCTVCGQQIDISIPFTGKYGDIDNDEKIQSTDALKILRYSVKLEDLNNYQFALADVNQDNSVDSVDSLIVLRYSVGLENPNTVVGEEKINFDFS